MAEENRLIERYRNLPAEERSQLVEYAGQLLSRRQEQRAESSFLPGHDRLPRERSDIGRYRWEQAGL